MKKTFWIVGFALALALLSACQPANGANTPVATGTPPAADETNPPPEVNETAEPTAAATVELEVTVVVGTPTTTSANEPQPANDFEGGTEELIAALEAEGAQVEVGDEVTQDFFPVTGRILDVEGVEVQVWEFEDEETRETAEGTIQAGGYIIGLAAIDWMDEPHFWSAGRVIALVVGDDGNTFDLLDRILGDELDTQEEGGESSGLLMSQLMNQFGLSADQIEIVSAEQTTWPDGCLGMAKSGEMCTQAMVPGWKVMARLDGTLYEIRTDELFNRLRYRVSQ